MLIERLLWREGEGDGVAAEGGMRDGGEIAADADVDGFAFFKSRRDRRVYLLMSVLQVIHHRLHSTKQITALQKSNNHLLTTSFPKFYFLEHYINQTQKKKTKFNFKKL
jgi:hypothetical protein